MLIKGSAEPLAHSSVVSLRHGTHLGVFLQARQLRPGSVLGSLVAGGQASTRRTATGRSAAGLCVMRRCVPGRVPSAVVDGGHPAAGLCRVAAFEAGRRRARWSSPMGTDP